jgi:transcriptional regulator with XRE-family HTH domain
LTVAAFKIFLSRQGDGTVAMVSKELKETRDKYHIGDKLRSLRLRRKIGLVELGKHTGLSSALLSKLEHNKLYPTLPTLSHIALVFTVGLEYFFADDKLRRTFALARKKSPCAFPKLRILRNWPSISRHWTTRRLNENSIPIWRTFAPCRSRKSACTGTGA